MLDDKFERTARLDTGEGFQDVGLTVVVVLRVKLWRCQGLIHVAADLPRLILLKGPAIGV